jgi:hypothetical protein
MHAIVRGIDRAAIFFAEDIPEAELAALRDATNGGFAQGSDPFQRQTATMVGRRPDPANPRDRSKTCRTGIS